MKFVQTLLALALAGSVGSAHAVGPGYLGDLVGQNLIVSNTIQTPVIGTPFTDIYSFDIGAYVADTIATSVKVTLSFGSSATPIYDISNFAIALRDTNNNVYAFDNVFNNGALDLVATLNPSAIGAPGFYEFVVTGNTAGSVGGAYLGALSAAPVPEAKNYAMMLAGLGLIGLMVERAKRHRI
jgi:hypothetical protein